MYGSAEEALAVQSVFDPIEMHGRFHMWLQWGFWNLISAVIFSLVVFFCKPGGYGLCFKLFMVLAVIVGLLLTLSMQLWTLFGAVYRFNKAGRTASGDFLEPPKDSSYKAEWLAEVED
mmetsp:Transcript_7833/g.9451  ORF Transcript_7833/g.9451 Transcript_7833/m.9451 type:complete len:118 (+) Transcript_7833:182-535(+)